MNFSIIIKTSILKQFPVFIIEGINCRELFLNNSQQLECIILHSFTFFFIKFDAHITFR